MLTCELGRISTAQQLNKDARLTQANNPSGPWRQMVDALDGGRQRYEVCRRTSGTNGRSQNVNDVCPQQLDGK